MVEYLSVYTECKCGHRKNIHIIDGKRPTRKKPYFISCGRGSYPKSIRYRGKCFRCKCNRFERGES